MYTLRLLPLKAARPEWHFDKVRANPGVSPSPWFSDRWGKTCESGPCFYISGSYSVCSLFFRFGRNRLLQNVLTFTFHSRMKVPNIRFATSSSTVFPKILPDVLSFLRHSCSLKSQSLILLLPSWRVRCLCSTAGPLLPRPIRRAVPARRVIHLRAAAKFFRDPPSPWLRYFCCLGALGLDAGHHTAPSVLKKFPLRPLP
jgi:hypothetical protein